MQCGEIHTNNKWDVSVSLCTVMCVCLCVQWCACTVDGGIVLSTVYTPPAALLLSPHTALHQSPQTAAGPDEMPLYQTPNTHTHTHAIIITTITSVHSSVHEVYVDLCLSMSTYIHYVHMCRYLCTYIIYVYECVPHVISPGEDRAAFSAHSCFCVTVNPRPSPTRLHRNHWWTQQPHQNRDRMSRMNQRNKDREREKRQKKRERKASKSSV